MIKVAVVWFIAGCLAAVFFSCRPVAGGTSVQGRQAVPAKDQRVAVLLFHAVDYVSTNPNSMSLEQLEGTFQALKTCGYHTITLQQFHDFINGKAPGQDLSYIYRISAGRNVHETRALLGWYFSKQEKDK